MVFLALPASAPAARAAVKARLVITVWPEGRGQGKPAQTWTLRCGPAGGTHPAPASACRRLFANLPALRPVSRNAVCTQQYGGPQEALVRGAVRGVRVNSRFNRRNGCEIARWDRLRVVLPGAISAARPPGAAGPPAGRTGPRQEAETSLEITMWPEGRDGVSTRTALACDPPAGSQPDPVSACRRLLALEDPFAPVPPNGACTMIWGGPEVAVVRGRFRGADVEAWFDRTNGCEIARWDRLAFLFPLP